MLKLESRETPIVYSCSGCSSAAQMANYIAVQLDRNGIGEMSCIAGVGGNVKKLVKTAKSGRPIVVIDGCPLACSKACLGNHLIAPAIHFDLSALGVKKDLHVDFDIAQAKTILKMVEKEILLKKEASYFLHNENEESTI
ncbi:MAG: putative zinc-binding protein [Chitinophagaceae bacterium]|nr:putative zinc-binding protein [Chitinophagaceae bacterium]